MTGHVLDQNANGLLEPRAPWTGRGGNWNCGDPQAYGCGGAHAFDFPDSAAALSPFGVNFQRGNAPAPSENGAAIYYDG